MSYLYYFRDAFLSRFLPEVAECRSLAAKIAFIAVFAGSCLLGAYLAFFAIELYEHFDFY